MIVFFCTTGRAVLLLAKPNPGFNRSVINPKLVAISQWTDNLNNGNFQFYSRAAQPQNELCCSNNGA